MSYTAKAAQEKKDVIQEFTALMKEYPIVGVVNLEDLPAKQEQTIRAKLREKVVLKMTKKRLMKRIFENAKKNKENVEKLEEYCRGMPALLFTKENPFSLFKTIKQNQSPAPAKAGQIAPKDIIVPAGGTNFAPGPVIGELGALGIKTKVEGGKLAITEDATVCKEGDEISGNLAAMLTRLNIMPMSVGLDLVALWENGDLLTRSVLDIDEDKFMADLQNCARWAFNLSCEAVIPTDLNREILIQKAFRDAKGLALEANIMCDAVAEELVAKAAAQAKSLQTTANIDLTAPAPKEEPKAEPAPEAPAPEAPAEPVEKKKEEPAAPVEEKKEEPTAEEKPAESNSTDDKVQKIVNEHKNNDGDKPSAEDLISDS